MGVNVCARCINNILFFALIRMLVGHACVVFIFNCADDSACWLVSFGCGVVVFCMIILN